MLVPGKNRAPQSPGLPLVGVGFGIVPRGTRLPRLLDRRALIITALMAGVWTALVVCRPGFEGMPFAWRSYPHSSPRPPARYDLLVVDVAIWFSVFYGAVRGFMLIRNRDWRRPPRDAR